MPDKNNPGSFDASAGVWRQRPPAKVLRDYWLPMALDAYRTDDQQMLAGDFGTIRIHGRVLQIALRGTKTIGEWAKDAESVIQVPDKFGFGDMVASGFSEIYEKIRSGITLPANIYQKEGSFDEIHVTGHSLGGGLSFPTAAELAIRYPGTKITVVTFAAPRYGSHAWRKRYDAAVPDTWRVEYEGDIVPGLPLALRFSHVGTAVKVYAGFRCIKEAHSLDSYRDGLTKLDREETGGR